MQNASTVCQPTIPWKECNLSVVVQLWTLTLLIDTLEEHLLACPRHDLKLEAWLRMRLELPSFSSRLMKMIGPVEASLC